MQDLNPIYIILYLCSPNVLKNSKILLSYVTYASNLILIWIFIKLATPEYAIFFI